MLDQHTRVWLDGQLLPLGQIKGAENFPLFLSSDRALHYGHGLFETMRVHCRQILFLEYHLQRMCDGLKRLHLLSQGKAIEGFLSQIKQTLESCHLPDPHGVLKVIVSAGASSQSGYAAAPESKLRTIIRWSPLNLTASKPSAPDTQLVDHCQTKYPPKPLKITVCRHRLPVQPALAGLKHLNRLDQVLAASEVQQSGFDEGIVCDIQGHPIEATASNVFIVKKGVLITPCLQQAGVCGVLRRAILDECAESEAVLARVLSLSLDDIFQADEVFLTNVVRGIRPVGFIQTPTRQQAYSTGPITRQLMDWLTDTYLSS